MQASDLPHEVVYFGGCMPAGMLLPRTFMLACPSQVRAKFFRILEAVAKAPPKRFSGGGYWEAMHGDMQGWFEVRADFRQEHYRLFCLLDYESLPEASSKLSIIAGLSKRSGAFISATDYGLVRAAGKSYLAANPRVLA